MPLKLRENCFSCPERLSRLRSKCYNIEVCIICIFRGDAQAQTRYLRKCKSILSNIGQFGYEGQSNDLKIELSPGHTA